MSNYLAGWSSRLPATTCEPGWAGLRNGDLLRHAMEAGFDVFLTGDQNFQFQQNLTRSSFRVIVLVAPTNRFQDLVPLVPRAIEAFSHCQSGEIIRISR